jgi:hypothetical protein
VDHHLPAAATTTASRADNNGPILAWLEDKATAVSGVGCAVTHVEGIAIAKSVTTGRSIRRAPGSMIRENVSHD